MSAVVNQNGDLEVTIIVVSYNTLEMTVQCIQSVLQQTSRIRYEVIVLDNASTDGSAEAIRMNFPDIKLIASAENLGFARANNLIAMHARGRRLLLLNPDTIILDHAIDKLHDFALANPECRIWGGRTVFADGRLNPASCWKRMTVWSLFCNVVGLSLRKESRLFNSEGYGGWKRDTVRAVDIVTGCFLLIDRDLWEQLRGFDSRIFMYGEEADLCLRARKIGARPTVTPTATIIHYGGASEPDEAGQKIKVLAGKVTLMKRHWSGFACFAGQLLYPMVPLTRMVGYDAFGALLGRADFRGRAQVWRQVWRSRQRWINGWDDVSTTGIEKRANPDSLDFGFDRQNAGSGSSLSTTNKGRTRNLVTVVVYHHIGDDKDALIKHLQLSTTPDVFKKQMDYFKRNFDFVSASDAISGNLPQKAILVTFDDAYRSVVDIAGPILKAVSAPSVFFTSPAVLLDDYVPTDNILSLAKEELGWEGAMSLVNPGGNDITTLGQLLIDIISGMTPAQLMAVRHRLLSAMGTTEAEIRRRTKIFFDPTAIRNLSELGIEIGNHSMHHSFFRSLSEHELQTEIVESRAVLQRLTGQLVQYLSIPYGNELDAPARVLELARASGHKAIFLVHGRSNRFPKAPDIFYRSHLGSASPRSLFFRLKITPILRSFRDRLQIVK